MVGVLVPILNTLSCTQCILMILIVSIFNTCYDLFDVPAVTRRDVRLVQNDTSLYIRIESKTIN
jgi:hypothetical protein